MCGAEIRHIVLGVAFLPTKVITDAHVKGDAERDQIASLQCRLPL